ncbi:MAG: DUF4145 domain-containing protein, partial [Pyramidobacter sp.]|nr:DUF4145 domain-containing protein [Pyramidobacter sp.]
ATLSRYLLHMILHEELKIKEHTLAEEIEKMEALNRVPSELVEMLHIMRKVANFGAHPKKSTNSAEIVDIEPGEAEIMLDLLEELFDFVFVKPKKLEQFKKVSQEKYGIAT